MEKMMLDDFIKYAKEQFDCDILLKSCDRPDTFESLFGASFLNSAEYSEKVEGFNHDLCYENISISVKFVMSNEMDSVSDSNVGLAA